MLEHIGRLDLAHRLRGIVTEVFSVERVRIADLGGGAIQKFAQAVISRAGNG